MILEIMRPLLYLLCLALLSCQPAVLPPVATEPPAVTLPASIKELTPAEAAAWMGQNPGALLLDLRMADEVTREGRLPGSRNHDYLQPATQEYIASLDRQAPILVYCALGGRSRHAAAEMHQLGFSQITLLKGGLNAWLAEGRSVVK